MAKLTDVVIIGAGASGLMCAAAAGYRGRKVCVIDHSSSPGKKILMSGGGRCNFTNRMVSADQYLCSNPHFCKSALSRFTPDDFLALIQKYGIAFHEREHGQLFCNDNASDILDMLVTECDRAGVERIINVPVESVRAVSPQEGGDSSRFQVKIAGRTIRAQSVVIATGGVSIPGSGSSPFGYKLAEQFGIRVLSPRPGLVPFTLAREDKDRFSGLSGVSVDARICVGKISFTEKLLFTHRGLSGPVVLQISSYWNPGEIITINFLPHTDIFEILKSEQMQYPKKHVKSVLVQNLPRRLVETLFKPDVTDQPVSALSHAVFRQISDALTACEIKPGGTEGYRTAEVTVGGVDCNAISSKTMESRQVPGLYFIGEVLDVTGMLGGYNLQWAWSSGFCAGQHV
ncbi:MAG: NAD(P)/FAD-dependent oxidoreductase [Proteobacteria bacterium]|nr:NAD(P)/FAD-dependent oxidoreductase [Pseudomonadota bacterium]MBU1389634.1 NAD(P)/FAD-dependent oxidoreductase [Pseudomonadota bacterium]MBU1542572.1 NAD(P)/FAD-dependent oxidoreductase [Pseudomonadota bacterium]MBU2429405.1 NAD(P)/FAD-dependent oxidoreductase [Pseudomonadota bacterium]MBU2479720.1 NAD(P)/FAD-dependent oxidoreductase [Pseudomonadota bacterium]